MRFSRVGQIVAGIAAAMLLTAYALRPPGLIDARGLAQIYTAALVAALGFAALIRMWRKP